MAVERHAGGSPVREMDGAGSGVSREAELVVETLPVTGERHVDSGPEVAVGQFSGRGQTRTPAGRVAAGATATVDFAYTGDEKPPTAQIQDLPIVTPTLAVRVGR